MFTTALISVLFVCPCLRISNSKVHHWIPTNSLKMKTTEMKYIFGWRTSKIDLAWRGSNILPLPWIDQEWSLQHGLLFTSTQTAFQPIQIEVKVFSWLLITLGLIERRMICKRICCCSVSRDFSRKLPPLVDLWCLVLTASTKIHCTVWDEYCRRNLNNSKVQVWIMFVYFISYFYWSCFLFRQNINLLQLLAVLIAEVRSEVHPIPSQVCGSLLYPQCNMHLWCHPSNSVPWCYICL